MLYNLNVIDSFITINPNAIINQSLTSSSPKVRAPSTYTFKFSIQDNIPLLGSFMIEFPINEISLPETLQNSDTRVKIYDNAWKQGSILLGINSITFTSEFTNSNLIADPTKFIQIEINGIINPKSLKESSSFKVSTLDANRNKINEAKTGLTVLLTQPGDIIVDAINPQIPMVEQATQYSFQLRLDQILESGSYFIIEFPSQVRFTSTLKCLPTIGFISDSELPCSFNDTNKIRVIIPNAKSPSLIFRVEQFINPSNTKASSPFKFQVYDKFDFQIAQNLTGMGISVFPGIISVNSVNRALNQVGQETSNNITFRISTPNIIRSGDKIDFQVPFSQAIPVTSSFKCFLVLSSGPIVANCQLNEAFSIDSFRVILDPNCSPDCPKNSQFTIAFAGIRNPPWIQSTTTSILIQTVTSDLLGLIDRRTTSIFASPSLIEGQISTKSLAKSGDTFVGGISQYELSFVPFNNIPAQGIVRLYFPPQATYQPSSGSINCLNIITSNGLTCTSTLKDPSSFGIDFIQINGLCQNDCLKGTEIKIRVSNLGNPMSNQTVSNSFAVRTFNSQLFAIDLGSITDATGLQVVNAQFQSLALPSHVSNIIVGQVQDYIFSVVSKNGIVANNGLLQIQFPPEILVQSVTCQSVKLPFVLNCQVTNQYLKISHTNTNVNFANEEIKVNFYQGAKNPQSMKPSSKFEFQNLVFDSITNMYYGVEYDAQKVGVTCDTPNQLQQVSVTRVNSTINSITKLIIAFTITNPLPYNSEVQIKLPKDQILFNSLPTLKNFQTLETLNVITEFGSQDSAMDSSTILIKQWCTSSINDACPSGTQLQLQITNGINPATTKPYTSTFEVFTQSEGHKIDQKRNGIQASPDLSAGHLLSFTISDTSPMIGQINSLSIQVTLQNKIDTLGQIQIQFPQAAYYENGTPLCFIQDSSLKTSTDCTYERKQSSMGFEITQVKINLKCGEMGCNNQQTKNLIIENVRNRFSYTDLTGEQFKAITLDKDNFSIDSAPLNVENSNIKKNLIPSTFAKFVSTSKSNMVVYQSLTLTVSFQTGNRIPKGSLFRIFVPRDAFFRDQNMITCGDVFVQAYDCTEIQDTLQKYYIVELKENCALVGQYCADNSTMTFYINGFINFNSLQPSSTNYLVQVVDSQANVLETNINTYLEQANLVTGQIQLSSLDLSNKVIGEATDLKMTVTAATLLQSNSFLRLTFTEPLIYKLNNLFSASINIDNTNYPCQITYQFLSDKLNFIELQITQKINSDTPFIVNLQGFKNGGVDKPLTINIGSQLKDSQQFSMATGTLVLNSQNILNPNTFTKVNVERKISIDVNQDSEFIVSVQVPIDIEQNSILFISIPKTQFVSQPNKLITMNLTSQFINEDMDYINLSTSEICPVKACSAGSTLFIRVINLKNPMQISPTPFSFKMRIENRDNYMILDGSNLNVFANPPLKVTDIKSLSVSQENLMTGQSTIYKFNLTFTNSMGENDKIHINFPDSTIHQQDLIEPACYAQNVQVACTYVKTDKFIKYVEFTNLCQKISCLTSITISVTKVLNSYYTRPRTGQFIISALIQSGYVYSQGTIEEKLLPVFQISPLLNFSTQRDSITVGQPNVDFNINFQTQNLIPDGSKFILVIPRDQVDIKNLNKLSCQSTSPVNRILQCNFLNSTNAIATYSISEWCQDDCQPNTKMSLRLILINNPASLRSPENSFQIYAFTSEGYGITFNNSNVFAQPKLKGTDITNIVSERELNTIGGVDYLKVHVVLPADFPTNSRIKVITPLNIAFFKDSLDKSECYVQISSKWQSVNCVYTYYQTSNSKYKSISEVAIDNVCGFKNCNLNSNLLIKFKIRNPQIPLVDNSKPYQLIFTEDGADIAQGSWYANATMTPNIIQARFIQDLQNGCYETGTNCPVVLEFNTTNPVPFSKDGYVQVTVPPQMSINGDLYKCFLFGTQTSCRRINSQLFEIRPNREIENSGDYDSYQYRIEIISLTSPFSTEPTESFQISTYTKEGTQIYEVDNLKTNLNYSVKGVSTFQEIKVFRSTTELKKDSQLLIQVTTRSLITFDTYFAFDIPESQAVFKSDTKLLCKDQFENSLDCIQSGQTFKVLNLCKQTTCPSSTYYIKIAKEFVKNPNYVIDPEENSNKVFAQYEKQGQTYYIHQTQDNLFLQPQLALSGMTIKSWLISSKFVADLTNLSIEVVGDSIFTQDYLKVQFKNQHLFSYFNTEVSINSVQTNLNTIYENSNGIIYLVFGCNSQCKNKQSFTIQISNIQNPYFKSNSQVQSAKIQVQQLIEAPNKAITGGETDFSNHFNELKFKPIEAVSLYQASPNISALNNLNLSFSLFNDPIVEDYAQLQLELPFQYSTQGVKCSHIFKNEQYQCFGVQNTIIVQGYFKANKDQILSGVQLNLQGIKNPASEINGKIKVKIYNSEATYVEDNDSLTIETVQLKSNCSLTNCEQCSLDDSKCYKCLTPSESPLLVQNTCATTCPQGSFESNGVCIKCHSECKECQTFDQCTKCQGLLLDGKCPEIQKCPTGTVEEILDGQKSCVSTEDCSSLCKKCGLDKSYCYECLNKQVSLNGKCESQCPPSYFESLASQCFRCDPLCAECQYTKDYCTFCQNPIFSQDILDLGLNSCVSECSSKGIKDPDNKKQCLACSSECEECSISINNCTKCTHNKETLEELFLINNQCLTDCPVGTYKDYDMHQCFSNQLEIAAFPPLYLISSAFLVGTGILISRFLTGFSDFSLDISIALLTQADFLNRVFLLFNLIVTTKILSFTVTGTAIALNAFLGIYLVTMFIQPIVKQIQSKESESIVFKIVVVLSQISGVSTIRLLTSKFMGSEALSNKFTQIIYYLKHLQICSMVCTLVCLAQLIVGIMCVVEDGSKDVFGFGVNTIIFNMGLMVLQGISYFKARAVLKGYRPVR